MTAYDVTGRSLLRISTLDLASAIERVLDRLIFVARRSRRETNTDDHNENVS